MRACTHTHNRKIALDACVHTCTANSKLCYQYRTKLSRNISLSSKSGFCAFFQPVVLSLSDDVKSSLMTELKSKDIQFVRVTAHKPTYEVGSSSQLKLSFGKNKTGKN